MSESTSRFSRELTNSIGQVMCFYINLHVDSDNHA